MTAMFLREPPASEAAEALYDQDLKEDGYVWNLTRLWTWRPDVLESFVGLRTLLMNEWGLTDRDRAVLVAAMASELGDSYCSLAWGAKLASLTDDETAALVLTGAPAPELSERESALAA
jgi:alkylhydroperoxidase family enzyme